MTKIYLVFAKGCKTNGKIDLTSQRHVSEVFTNRKLALKYADYMNQSWRQALLGNSNSETKISWYWVETKNINKEDYSKLPY